MSAIDTELLQKMISLQETVMKLSDRVLFLESQLAAEEKSLNMPRKPVVVRIDETKASELLWACSPSQHAMIQLIFRGMSNLQISKRLHTTEGSIKARFRHLCSRLGIRSRRELEVNYVQIFERVEPDKYLSEAKISIDWADIYGDMTFTKAKQKKNGDPFHVIICETRYRGARLV